MTIATYTIRSKGIIKGEPLRFVNGHSSRNRLARERDVLNPSGLCMCGCGQPAPIAKATRIERGQVRGKPVRFINGHNSHRHTDESKTKMSASSKGRRVSDETRAKIAAAHRGLRHTEEAKAKMSASSKLQPRRFGEDAPGWKTGRTVVRGRVLVYVGRDHPMAYASGYVFEHRLVAAAALGRMLGPDEHVHHVDLDPLNNAPENLVILTPNQHGRIHRFIDYRQMSPAEAVAAVLGKPA